MFKGDRLKDLRKEKGLTQGQLGEILGIDKSTICCYEKGTRQPPIENIIDFMQIFNVSADFLLGTDHLITTISDEPIQSITMSKEELVFLEELKKDKTVYNILISNPKRAADIVKKHLV